jgi:polysaccharide export outer membrane protein
MTKIILKTAALILIVGTLAQCSSADSGAPRANMPNTATQDEASAQESQTNVAQAGAQSDDESGSAAAPKAPANGTEYKIIPGDVLQITVWKEEELNQEVLVLNDGTINFPLIGTIEAAGKTTAELQEMIKDKLSKLIPDASVTVAVKAALGHTVSVIGQVTKPGELVMDKDLTVMQALSQAGGLTPYADDGRIIILRRENGKETSIRFPYDDVIDGDELDKDIVLRPGDVVVVPTAGLL